MMAAVPRSTVICSILERDAAAAERRMQDAPPDSGLVEIRADHLDTDEIRRVVRAAHRPLLVTIRRTADGGGFEGSESQRRARLLAALDAGARFIDVEWRGGLAELADGDLASRVVLSHHGSPCDESALKRLHGEMSTTSAARLKIVPKARAVREALAVRALLRDARDSRLASFAEGRLGTVTRLLAPAWGSWATYGAARGAPPTGEGQLSAAEMIELHDVTGIGPNTRLFALIGGRVSASPSPAIHRAGQRSAGIDARYIPIELDELDDFAALISKDGLALEGFATTMPFKEQVAARCRSRDALSEASGAVNTVVLRDDAWHGHNTDGPAALRLVRERIDPTDKRVVVLGAGGTARALAVVFREAGARVTLVHRDPARGAAVASALGVGHAGDADPAKSEWQILANATPLGTRGEVILPDERLRGDLVLDAVYGAKETPLVAAARRRGLAVVDGYQLLVAQAVLQFEHMLGRRPDRDAMERAGRRWLDARRFGL